MSDKNIKGQSRRQFLIRAAGVGAAAAGLAIGCGQDGDDGKDGAAGNNATTPGDDDDEDSVDDSISWDESVDVLIVGAGGAGMVAAIEAGDAGASVLIIEKRSIFGGSTALSGGVLQASGTTYQVADGVTDDNSDKHFQYWNLAGEGNINEDLVRLMADRSATDIEWLGANGITWDHIYAVDPIPYVPEELMLRRLHVAEGQGGAYATQLLNLVQQRNIEVRYETPAKKIYKNAEGRVVGLQVLSGDETRNIQAKKAVILACGGFDRNLEMARAFSPQLAWDLENNFALASSENTGDGLRMGIEIGADLAGLGGTISYPNIRVGRAEGGSEIPGLWINKYGQRFVNEATHYGYASRAVFDQEEHLAWAIFDENVKNMGGATIGGWSDDLETEIASGKIIKGDTLNDLAQELEINAGQLELTFQKWNTDMNTGPDTVYGKQVSLSALDTAPYYAVRVQAYNVGSCGGLRIDTEAHVIDVNGEAIPGLYAAGMVSGGFIGPYYPGSGTAVTATVVFGRIAGKNAAAE